MKGLRSPESETERRARLGRAVRWRTANPRAHWRLLGLCLVMVLVLVTFQGFCTHTLGASAEPDVSPGSSAPLRASRPLLVAHGGRLRSPQPPPGRRIALTFDDGPDPTWTPKVAAVLRAARVPATFFMVGSQAARHPDIVRLVQRSGGEIGDHTFTHSSLTSGPMWQRKAQLDFTEVKGAKTLVCLGTSASQLSLRGSRDGLVGRLPPVRLAAEAADALRPDR